MSIQSLMQSNHLILFSPSLALKFPRIGVFSNEISSSYQVAKALEPQHQSFNECSGLISLKIDWFDLLAVQGTLKILPHHYSSKAYFLQCSAFFMVQLLHRYMTTGKIIALTIWKFAVKTVTLLFNTLSRFLIDFLPRSKCLLLSLLQSYPQWFWSLRKLSLSLFQKFSPSINHEVMGPDAMISVFWMFSFKLPFPLFSFINLHQEAS